MKNGSSDVDRELPLIRIQRTHFISCAQTELCFSILSHTHAHTHLHARSLYHVLAQENLLNHTVHYTSFPQNKRWPRDFPTTHAICRPLQGLSQTHPWSSWATPAPICFGPGIAHGRALSWQSQADTWTSRLRLRKTSFCSQTPLFHFRRLGACICWVQCTEGEARSRCRLRRLCWCSVSMPRPRGRTAFSLSLQVCSDRSPPLHTENTLCYCWRNLRWQWLEAACSEYLSKGTAI